MDVSSLGSLRVAGSVFFFFGCHSAGTVAHSHHPTSRHRPAAKHEFPLSCRSALDLLARGAVACIGQVNRVHGTWFVDASYEPRLEAFETTIRNILAGAPVGDALRDFRHRAASLSTYLERAHETDRANGRSRKMDVLDTHQHKWTPSRFWSSETLSPGLPLRALILEAAMTQGEVPAAWSQPALTVDVTRQNPGLVKLVWRCDGAAWPPYSVSLDRLVRKSDGFGRSLKQWWRIWLRTIYRARPTTSIDSASPEHTSTTPSSPCRRRLTKHWSRRFAGGWLT